MGALLRGVWFGVPVALSLLPVAHAQTVAENNCNAPATVVLNVGSVQVNPNVALNQPMTAWIALTEKTNAYHCTRGGISNYNVLETYFLAIRPFGGNYADSAGMVSDGGQQYRLYLVNKGTNNEFGFIARWVNPYSGSQTPLVYLASSGAPTNGTAFTRGVNAGTQWNIRTGFAFRFIKTRNGAPANVSAMNTWILGQTYYVSDILGSGGIKTGENAHGLQDIIINMIPSGGGGGTPPPGGGGKTCTTPSVSTWPLAAVNYPSGFSGTQVGATSEYNRTFTLEFTNCTASVKSLRVYFERTNPLGIAPGTLATLVRGNNTSTARGFGMQVIQEQSHNPVTFFRPDSQTAVLNTQCTPPTCIMTFRVRYIRTNDPEPVRGGTLNTSMLVHVTYP